MTLNQDLDIIEKYDGNWKKISASEDVTAEFLRYYKDQLDWDILVEERMLKEDTIREFQDYIDFSRINYMNRYLSEEFLIEFKDKLDWKHVSTYQVLSEEFIREHQDLLDWKVLATEQSHLSMEFLEEFKDRINWDDFFLMRADLTEEIIEKFATGSFWDSWEKIFFDGNVSEDFLRKHQDKINFQQILLDTVSKEFIEEFQERINWTNLYLTRREFVKKEFPEKIEQILL